MLDAMMFKLFPTGADAVACLTEAGLLVGAILFLGLAIFAGAIEAIGSRRRISAT